jgi:hypothetical protein
MAAILIMFIADFACSSSIHLKRSRFNIILMLYLMTLLLLAQTLAPNGGMVNEQLIEY